LEDELHLSVVLADGQATKIHRYPEPTRELKSKIMSLLQSLKRNGKKPKDTNVPLADLAPLAILEADILNIASTIMNTIEPALQRGQIVLCDKYIYSVFVRNFLRKSKSDAMVSALSFAIKPDLVLLFDKSPDAATAQVLSSKLQVRQMCFELFV
jgi:thymidylate kinase